MSVKKMIWGKRKSKPKPHQFEKSSTLTMMLRRVKLRVMRKKCLLGNFLLLLLMSSFTLKNKFRKMPLQILEMRLGKIIHQH